MTWADFNHRTDKGKIAKLIKEKLGEPRLIVYDHNLEVRIDNERYKWSDYSDAHWIFQVFATYRGACSKTMGFSNLCAAACEKILLLSLKFGPQKAKKEAEELSILGVPSWISLSEDDPRWQEVRRGRLEYYKRIKVGD